MLVVYLCGANKEVLGLTVTIATPLAKALARFRDINDREKKMSC